MLVAEAKIMRTCTVLMGVLLAGCGSAQSGDQFRILREELGIVRDKLDQSQKQLQANKKQVAQLEEQVKELSRHIKKEPYCKLRMPGLRAGGTRAPRGGVRDLMSPFGSNSLKLDISRSVTRVGPGRYRIKRSGLNKVLGNTMLLARSARIVPSVRNGRPNGFKIYAIRPGSIYALLGFYNGDTITAINGMAITSPDKALAVYSKLRNANKLTIQFNRRGRPMVHRYTIVP